MMADSQTLGTIGRAGLDNTPLSVAMDLNDADGFYSRGSGPNPDGFGRTGGGIAAFAPSVGSLGVPGSTAISAAPFAMGALAEALGVEMGPTYAAPGSNVGRYGTSDVYTVSDPSSFSAHRGSPRAGMTMAPGSSMTEFSLTGNPTWTAGNAMTAADMASAFNFGPDYDGPGSMNSYDGPGALGAYGYGSGPSAEFASDQALTAEDIAMDQAIADAWANANTAAWAAAPSSMGEMSPGSFMAGGNSMTASGPGGMYSMNDTASLGMGYNDSVDALGAANAAWHDDASMSAAMAGSDEAVSDPSMAALNAMHDFGPDTGGDSDSGGKVICGELNRQGIMPDEIYAGDLAYQREYVKSDTVTGYLIWARPIVRIMRKSKVATQIVRPFAMAWAEEMAWRAHRVGEGNLLGAAILHTVAPVCTLIGKVIRWSRKNTFSVA